MLNKQRIVGPLLHRERNHVTFSVLMPRQAGRLILIIAFAPLMLVGAAMALHTVLIIADPLVQVLASDFRRRMLVASVTGVLREIALRMAGCARRVMVTIEHEIFVMIKCRRLPLVLTVTLRAARCQLFMQRIARLVVARLALILRPRSQQCMRELLTLPVFHHALMVGVAFNTLFLDQLPMKGYLARRSLNR